MARDREERFEIQPKAPKRGADTPRAVAGVFKTITHYARQSRKLTPSRGRSSGGGGAPHFQRCAVRVTYASNRVRGQWRAHGKYVAREAATEAPEREIPLERESTPEASRASRERVAPGYDARGVGIDVGQQLDAWQGAGDPRLSKFILSPAVGERVDIADGMRVDPPRSPDGAAGLRGDLGACARIDHGEERFVVRIFPRQPRRIVSTPPEIRPRRAGPGL